MCIARRMALFAGLRPTGAALELRSSSSSLLLMLCSSSRGSGRGRGLLEEAALPDGAYSARHDGDGSTEAFSADPSDGLRTTMRCSSPRGGVRREAAQGCCCSACGALGKPAPEVGIRTEGGVKRPAGAIGSTWAALAAKAG